MDNDTSPISELHRDQLEVLGLSYPYDRSDVAREVLRLGGRSAPVAVRSDAATWFHQLYTAADGPARTPDARRRIATNLAEQLAGDLPASPDSANEIAHLIGAPNWDTIRPTLDQFLLILITRLDTEKRQIHTGESDVDDIEDEPDDTYADHPAGHENP